MATRIVCWRCGSTLQYLAKPFPRLAKCRVCDADLHVCRLCRHYNPQASGRCEHELAVPAREVDIANFCQYFAPRPAAYARREAEQARAARQRLEALFRTNAAGSGGADSEVPQGLKDLFKD